MNLAVGKIDDEHALFLRVLGERPAESAPFLAGRSVQVGYGLDNDVAVRRSAMKGVQFSLLLGEQASQLTLVKGAVILLGQRIEAPASIFLPAYIPLTVDDVVLAVGGHDARRWMDALHLAQNTRNPAPTTLGTSLPKDEAEGGSVPPKRSWKGLALPATVGLLAIVAVGTWLVLAGVKRTNLSTPATIQALLTEKGFAGLTITDTPGRGLVVHGLLNSDADAAGLLSLLRTDQLPLRSDVQTMDGLARLAEEIFRSGGVPATAKSAGRGRLVVSVGNIRPEQLELLRRAALARLPQLTAIDFIGAELGVGLSSLSSDDPGKAIIAISHGPQGFLSSADGSKYFVGGVLPDGRTITAIADHSVQLSRDGIVNELEF